MNDSFDSAMEGLRITDAGPDVRELVELLARHGETEAAMLGRYQRFVEEASAPEIRYLVGLVIDDERRHHRILGEMANAIAWGTSAESPVPAVPDITGDEDVDDALRDETRQLLKAEERDRLELRQLRKRLRPFRDITLWELIVDMLILDTEKHIKILRLISKVAEEA